MTNAPRIDLVVPVYNEAHVLAASIRTITGHLERTSPYDWRVIIADNASTDATPGVAAELARRDPQVRSLRIESKGRGIALKRAWSASDAEVCAYTDVDLSTGLEALGTLFRRIFEGYEIAVGSRLIPEARVTRGLKRDVLSRGYNLLVRRLFHTSIADAQCGFKAVSRKVVQDLLPLVHSDGWFFDTELLLLAERTGYRIAEVPVRWVEDHDSRVRIGPTVLEYLRELRRLRRAWGSSRPRLGAEVPGQAVLPGGRGP